MKLEHKFEHLQLLYELTQAVNRADEPGAIYRAAVEGLVRVVAADRASVMIFDADGVMRYKAWKGISDRHRATMEQPITIKWRRGARNVQVVAVADVKQDASLSPIQPALENEGIRALALIPLLGNGGLIGKFVLYYNAPHEFLTEELKLAETIATHVAFAAERHLAEAALRESEERFRAMFFQAAVGITQTGRDGKWLLLNDRFCEILGYSQAELLGKTFLDVTHPDDREASLNAVRQLKAGEISSWSTEKRYIRKDGTTVWARLVTSVVRDEHNQPQCAISVVEDVTDRKQAEAALRESEERFRATFFQAAVGIAQTGLDGQWLLLNDRLCQILGYSRAELRGKTFLDITHPDDRDANVVALDQFLAGEISSWSTEKRYVHKNGATVWAKVHVSLVRNQHKQPQYFISVVEDVTERKLIEERLRASETRLREAQRLAKLVSWERVIDTDTIHWSDEVLRIFGLPADTLANFVAFLSYVHPKDRAKILKADSNVRSSGVPVEVEYRIMRPDGATRFVRSIVEAIRNDQGVPVRVVGTTQDITEQVKARELLRESEERLKNAERLAHVGHWHWDLNSDQVLWSQEIFQIFGQPRDYAPSYEGFFQAVIPQNREWLRREMRDAVADNRGFSSEVQIARPNGDLRTITFVAEVLLDEESLLIGMFGAIQDITDLRRAQRADFARQKLESIGTLASGIAHDFNNLLGSVLVQADVALGGLGTGLSPEEELKTIRNVALRGSEIVRELMIYAGKESVVVGLVDVSKIVREMLELLRVSVSKHAVLEADLGHDLPSVRANAAQLRQIVMNLITNASDAVGDRDGVIRLSTSCVKVDQDSGVISDRLDEGDYVQLEVSDTGRGMPPETQAKVFDPFFTTKSAGHGLGLSMVNGIVRSLGGAIHLSSEPGKGTTFQILLPCSETRAEEESDKISGIESLRRPSPDGTVLIVEDEGPLRQAVTKMLRKTGFDVLEVGDGSSAIDLLRGKGDKIDLILLDMTIPGASSPEVVAEAAKVRPDVRVILTSAYSEEMVAGAMNTPQIRSFIRKPFQLEDLLKTLRNSLAS